jgi:hypothetical protein
VQIDPYSSSWSHTASPKARKKFVAFLSQIPPRGPFLPVVPVNNYCTVNNMRFVAFLDTEEVAGSNPVVPTKIRFKDIQGHPNNAPKPLKNKRLLSFYVQQRIVKAMFPWG